MVIAEDIQETSSLYEQARLNRSFSRILHRKMLEKGWRNRDLVGRMNDLRPPDAKLINRQIITSYTSGRSTPPLATALLIAQALECDLVDLLKNTDSSSSNLTYGASNVKTDSSDEDRCYVRLKIDIDLPISICADIMDMLQQHLRDSRPVSTSPGKQTFGLVGHSGSSVDKSV